jgi:YYY domain-containing protein
MVAAVVWFLTIQALGLAVLPLTVRVFGGLPDRGYGLSRVLGLVVVGWLTYLTAMLGFTAYVSGTVAVLALLTGGTLWIAWGRGCLDVLRARVRLLAAEEIAFLAIFGVGTYVRAYNADIVGQEKFMDYAFMHALLRTSSLPAEDMWLSGFAMPYYYLGYLLVGLPAKIAATAGPLAYSLAVVLVFATGFAATLSITYALVTSARAADPDDAAVVSGRRLDAASLAFGLLGGTLTMVTGNLVGALELFAARGWGSPELWAAVGVKGLGPVESPTWLPVDGGWWWRSSRVIPNISPDGITEFPYFSFILGDLHPHYMAIPFALLVVALATSRWLDPERMPDLSELLIGGVALATLIPASTWDVPTFWGLYFLAFVGDAWRREGSREKVLARLPALALPVVVAFVLSVPYFVGYQSQPLGLGFVHDRTPLVSMLILFGPALLVATLFAIWLAGRGDRLAGEAQAGLGRLILAMGLLLVGLSAMGEAMLALLFAILVALLAAGGPLLARRCASRTVAPAALFCLLLTTWVLCILIGTELIYIRDVFGSRMNTVFKFQYHAWLLSGIASASALGLIWRTRLAGSGWRRVSLLVSVLILIPGLAYPIGATWTKSNGFRGEATLMGDRFLERGAPADHRAIEWLRQNVQGRPVVVEAVGGDYTEHARVSTFSGLPTLIGWVGHELQWRGERQEFGRRQQAVDAIYRATTREEIERIADMYRVGYVFFGNLERAKYGPEAQSRLDKLLPVAYSRGGTTIYRVESE